MTPTRRARKALAAALAVPLLMAGTLSGCSVVEDLTADDPAAAPSAPAAQEAEAYSSQFTRDGTFQSHIDIDGVDFVYTLYPTKSTPRTHEWYPKGKKYFSFTFQAYDLERKLRDPFRTKRKVWLEHIKVTSRTVTSDGGATERPYRLDAVAKDVTFDPEPLSTALGMLITSPKGAFELRNQAIGPTSDDTRGIELTFTAVVWVQKDAGQNVGPAGYERHVVKQTVPIAIFESDEPTEAAKIPVNAN